MYSTESGIVTLASDEARAKAPSPMYFTDVGILIDLSEEQPYSETNGGGKGEISRLRVCDRDGAPEMPSRRLYVLHSAGSPC